MLDSGTVVSWWEIGVVSLDENSKNEILDLLSPICRVTFRECQYSYAQRETAYNEILARSKVDANILGVIMGRNTEAVFVATADGVEKEYAVELIRQYGSFVTITNDLNASVNDALTGGRMEGGMDTGAGMGGGGYWFWPLCLLVALLGLAAVLFFNRTRLAPAMQTTQGTVVTRGAPVSAKETVLAVKNSEVVPDDKVFDAIRQRIGG